MPVLQWLTRDEDVRAMRAVPYCLLEEAPALSYRASRGDADGGNILIQGDNLAALKALLPFYAGQVKCVYIDPPYNTGAAFEHYDDNLEHSRWLALMWPRLELLRELLAEDGLLWINLDDSEVHYLKVVLDELFGRKNFISHCIWEKKRKPAFLARIGNITDHILLYAKHKNNVQKLTFSNTAEGETYPLYNAGNKLGTLVFPPGKLQFKKHQDGHYEPSVYKKDTSCVKLISDLTIKNGFNTNRVELEGEWRYSQSTIDEQFKQGEHYVVKSLDFRPRRIVLQSKKKKVHNLFSRAHYDMATNEDAAKEGLCLFGENTFNYPKPEQLIQFIISISSKPGDLVLDSFLGSGTTAAVAHKMGRRYIGIEMGEHAVSHCRPRLVKVADGEQGGISRALGWQGGGGFRFYRLGARAFSAEGRICPNIAFATLAAHVWFSETRTPWPASPTTPEQSGKISDNPALGIHQGIGYALLYNGVLGDKRPHGGNVLTGRTLGIIRAGLLNMDKAFAGALVIYGESSRLSAARLKAEGITFKQMPYELQGRHDP